MASFTTPERFLLLNDAQFVGDLVSDTGTTVAPSELLDNPVLRELIVSVSSEIFAALIVGERYSAEQLQSLTQEAADYLHLLTCDGVLLRLKQRRGRFNSEKDGELQKRYEARIKSAKDGDALLYLPEAEQVGTLRMAGPTVVDRIATPNTFRDSPNQQYYPARRRKTRLP